MELFLLRHGIAAEPASLGSQQDAVRPLTEEGERKIKSVARALRALDLSFDLILSSPYLRALETARIVARQLELSKRLEITGVLKPEGSFRELIDLLETQRCSSVLLVGHEPFLSGLTSFLLTGRTTFEITMKKGGLAKLTAQKLKYGRCASLEWLLTARHMALMSGDAGD
jgi:phosphohistidine phosphatase